MSFTIETRILSYEGAQRILAAAMAKAAEMKVPQCISIVDAGGHLLAFARMDGAFAMSMPPSLMKAKTAASCGEPTGNILDGRVVGAIGMGSGTGEQDRQVAAAALKTVQFD